MARHSQARAHGALRVRGDDAQAGAGRFADDHRITNVDIEFVELGLVVQAVAIVADATDEGAAAAKLRASDDGVGDAAAADQPRFSAVKSLKQRLLFRMLNEAHRTTLEPQRGEIRFVELEEDIHEGVAESAKVELSMHDCFRCRFK